MNNIKSKPVRAIVISVLVNGDVNAVYVFNDVPTGRASAENLFKSAIVDFGGDESFLDKHLSDGVFEIDHHSMGTVKISILPSSIDLYGQII
jgi:hypothetical protein